MTPNELNELKAQLEELIEKIHLTKFIPVGCTSTIREKERWIIMAMHRLSLIESSNSEE